MLVMGPSRYQTHPMLPARLSSLLLVLACLLAGTAGHQVQQEALYDPPEWLLGLPQLLQPTQPAVITSTPTTSAAGQQQQGQLLRPNSLPKLLMGQQLATTIQTADPTPQPHSTSLASVARRYSISPDNLRSMMQEDEGLRVSHQGLLVWACLGDSTLGDTGSHSKLVAQAPVADDVARDGNRSVLTRGGREHTHPVAETQAAEGLDGHVAASILAVDITSQQDTSDSGLAARHAVSPATAMKQPGPQPPPELAFKLHTRPPGSVQHTIFLDFRGCSISNTFWNTATSKAVLNTQPFDLDGDPGTFSVKEQEAVVSIWQAVAQDFAPWAVDVTTEDPGVDALVR